jgi:voltage-gated potassium channel Kch
MSALIPATFYDRLYGWRWWLISIFAVLAFSFGSYGLWMYESVEDPPVNLGNVIYHTLQMFILHTPHFKNHINWAMEIGRWMAASVFMMSVFFFIFKLFKDEVRLIGLGFYRHHVIICGLGKIGLRLAYQFKKQGYHVVAIETRSQTEALRKADSIGIPVIIGDAKKEKYLRRARFRRASHVFAVTSDDNTNISIAFMLNDLFFKLHPKKMQGKPDHETTKCWLFILDQKIRREIEYHYLLQEKNPLYEINIRGMDIFTLSARKAHETFYLDYIPIKEKSNTEVLFIVAGFDQMGEAMILQALKVGHYANEHPIRIAIIDSDAENKWADFIRRHPVDKSFCTADILVVSIPDDPGYLDKLAELSLSENSKNKIITYAFCYENKQSRDETDIADDNLNFVLASRLAKLVKEQKLRILFYQDSNRGFAMIFPSDNSIKTDGVQIIPFGMIEDTVYIDDLLNEKQDLLAIQINKHYLKNLPANIGRPESDFDNSWNELSEDSKDSSRQSADHIPVKMRAIGTVVSDLQQNKDPITDMSKWIDLLSKIEHNRWFAEKTLAGWVPTKDKGGKKDPVKKEHPDLVPWKDLLPAEQRKDIFMISAIPECLRVVGKGVFQDD